MMNPWLDLPDGEPYVLPGDVDVIERHNQRASDARRFRLELLPEPFIGRIDAPIVILMTNPGWGPLDHFIYATDYAREVYRKNLAQAPLEHSFYMIDPVLVGGLDPALINGRNKIGPYWWLKTLKHLIEATDQKTVANNILGVEYIPYHSQRNPGLNGLLASQQFGFDLVRRAMERQAVILVGRSFDHWYRAVSGLCDYPHRHERAPRMQNAMITRTIHPTGFTAALEVLQHGR